MVKEGRPLSDLESMRRFVRRQTSRMAMALETSRDRPDLAMWMMLETFAVGLSTMHVKLLDPQTRDFLDLGASLLGLANNGNRMLLSASELRKGIEARDTTVALTAIACAVLAGFTGIARAVPPVAGEDMSEYFLRVLSTEQPTEGGLSCDTGGEGT